MIAYRFNPEGRMEERNGWQRAMLAAQAFDVTIIFHPTLSIPEMHRRMPSWIAQKGIQLVPVEHRPIDDKLVRNDLTFYAGYRHWQQDAYRVAKRIHATNRFDLTHFVSLCGFREPGFVWKMDAPFIWGPLGGTHYFPRKYLGTIGTLDAIRESIRSFLNCYQLHVSRSIHQAARRSSLVLAASHSEKRSLQKGLKVACEVELETGIDYEIAPPRVQCSDEDAFRILWAGRIRAWKGLPLLLHALSRIEKKDSIAVRVMGIGDLPGQYRSMAKKLRIDHLIEWVPWVNYRHSLAQYDWAHAFTFTSLRDTSGTGLLESLAAGCPIIGLNHQGAADIMTPDCSIPIPVECPEQTIQSIANAIEFLRSNKTHWLMLSHGATKRASDFLWKDRGAKMIAMYNSVLQSSVPNSQ